MDTFRKLTEQRHQPGSSQIEEGTLWNNIGFQKDKAAADEDLASMNELTCNSEVDSTIQKDMGIKKPSVMAPTAEVSIEAEEESVIQSQAPKQRQLKKMSTKELEKWQDISSHPLLEADQVQFF
ncbi:hypothetical protein L218DRAFT_950395 [Marasmius fiardii PR-910]|nr:hypothetical protein L218DRAFT_950395 [Marasmius fiardii PR-910]